jgi:hypothetical protein
MLAGGAAATPAEREFDPTLETLLLSRETVFCSFLSTSICRLILYKRT